MSTAKHNYRREAIFALTGPELAMDASEGDGLRPGSKVIGVIRGVYGLKPPK